MALMTSSPGVLYNVDGVFKDGPAKGKILPGFNLDTRKPLAANSKSSTAAIYSPKLPGKVPTNACGFIVPSSTRLLRSLGCSINGITNIPVYTTLWGNRC